MTTITIENVSKIYDGKVIGVDDISLMVEDGEFIAFLGPSGCGKTSTLRMIAGLEEITMGTISFDGNPINNIPPNHRNIAMAFENYGLYPHMSVYQNIAYPLKLRKIPAEQIAREVISIVRLLKIEDFVDEKPNSLSGGVQQRISLARALVRKPNVLLLDEPISHLDSELRNQMRGELKRLHALNMTTTVYVTHDQLEALTMADRVAVMNKGKIRQVGTPKEIFTSPQDQFVATFVGEPPMNILSAKIFQKGDIVEVKVGESTLATYPVQRAQPLLDEVTKTNFEINVGIRPMDFEIISKADEGISFRISLREHLGDNTLYHLYSDIGTVLFLTPRINNFEEGGFLELKPIHQRIHYFSKATTMVVNLLN
jgi:multiple sugar transport system ATP-binding protein